MAEFTHEEQVEIVRKALFLETAVQVEQANASLLKSQQFDRFPAYEKVFRDTPPAQPQRKVCQRPAPIEAVIPEPPKAAYSIADHLSRKQHWVRLFAILIGIAVLGYLLIFLLDWPVATLLSLLALLALPVSLVACFVDYLKEKRLINQQLANSAEYQQAVITAKQYAAEQQAQIDYKLQQEQARLDAQFDAEIEHYNNVLLPSYERTLAEHRAEYNEMRREYERDKAEWEAKRQGAIAELEKDIAANEASLADLYDSTRIISLHYREIPILEWLYDDMRTSDHDIRYATELLDRDRQRIVTEEAGTRTAVAIGSLRDEVHQGFGGVMSLQGVEIQSLRNLEAISEAILNTTEDIYVSSEKIIFHQRVNTADIGLREWRRHEAKKAAK